MPSDDTFAHLTFWEHAGVLRRYVLLGGAFFFAASLVVFHYAGAITAFLLKPLGGQTLVFLTPTGPFFFEVRISFIGAMVVSFPLWIFLISQFAGEALSRRRRRRFIWFVIAAALIGLAALVLSYRYLVPASFEAFTSFIVPGTSLILTADSYVTFVLLVTTACFTVAELPVALTALAYVRLVNPYVLARHRRWLWIGVLVVMGVVTPTADVVTLLFVSVPAVLCTEAGLALAKLAYNKEA